VSNLKVKNHINGKMSEQQRFLKRAEKVLSIPPLKICIFRGGGSKKLIFE
jgi:hypothetical protein